MSSAQLPALHGGSQLYLAFGLAAELEEEEVAVGNGTEREKRAL